MRASMAYFAGAGTIVVAIAAGLGGGLTIANVMSPHQEKQEQSKLEQRMSAKPVPPSAEADQSTVQANNSQAVDQAVDKSNAPVPYLAATQAATNGPVTVTPAPQTQNQPQPQAAAPAPQSSPQPVEAKGANDQPAKSAESQPAKRQATPREQASSAPEDSNAKDSNAKDSNAKDSNAKDSNVKARSSEDANATARDSDLKRLAAEKRKAQRRQQLADRKKAQQQRDAELRDAEADVPRDTGRPLIRDSRDTDGPRIVVRRDDDDLDRRGDSDRRRDPDRRGGSDRPFGFPGFNLFGGDRDD
jgi:hypothetical protein